MRVKVSCHVLLALFFGILCTAHPVAAKTWYVDDNAPNDPGPGDTSSSDPDEDGTTDHPFDAIAEAINAAPLPKTWCSSSTALTKETGTGI